MIAGSGVAPLLIGVALGDLLHGLPIDKAGEFTGNFLSPGDFRPPALLAGQGSLAGQPNGRASTGRGGTGREGPAGTG